MEPVMTTISTGGGAGHTPGCSCPFCTSTATTGEVDGIDLVPTPGEQTDGPELLCAVCCGEVHDFEPSMGDGYSWAPGTCPRCGVERTVFNLTDF